MILTRETTKEKVESNMNFLTDPCIDVIMSDGAHKSLSVLDTISEAHNILNFDGFAPSQFFSTIRFFVAVTQGSLNGPKDTKDWESSKNRIQEKSIKYLKKYKTYFEQNNFLQLDKIHVKKSVGIRELGLYWKEGNNALVFEHNPSQEIKDKDLFKILLAFQSFSPISTTFSRTCGTSSPVYEKKTKGDAGDGEEKGKAILSPCSRYLVTCICGETLLDTIWLNLITKKDCEVSWGKPIWEYENKFKKSDIEELRTSYLGRMVPINRSIKIDGENFVGTQGIDYLNDLNGAYDPMLSYITNNQKKNVFLRIDESRHAWRSLYFLKSAPVIKNLSRAKGIIKNVRIYTGGITFGAMNCGACKIANELDWSLTFPIAFLDDEFQLYTNGVNFADFVELKLSKAIYEYAKNSLSGNKKANKILGYNAKEIFWSDLNKNHRCLIDNINDQINWQEFVIKASKKAFYSTCNTDTAFDLKGFVLGEKHLAYFPRKPEDVLAEIEKIKTPLKAETEVEAETSEGATNE